MSLKKTLLLAAGACSLALGAFAVAHRAAEAAANPIVVQRFLLGYFSNSGKFIPIAGRYTTNVSRNAVLMFVFTGAPDAGPNRRATLPLTLNEQAELQARIEEDPDYDPTRDGFEPGVIPRRRSTDPGAYYVATGTVSPASISIQAQTANGGADAEGQFFKVVRRNGTVVGSRLVFNPRYSQSTFNNPTEIDYHPEGLAGDTVYTVTIDGGPNASNPELTLRNLSGELLGEPFFVAFATGDRYVQDFSRPDLETTSPTDRAINVSFDSDIEFEFSEPMDVSSFVLPKFQGDDQWTTIVRYTANPANGIFQGRNVLGVMRVKPQTAGNVVQFRPLQGFGKGPSEIEVIITTGVTDLSGNNIVRQAQFTFTTEYNPNAEEFAVIEEFFSNTTKRDTTFVPSGDYVAASWNAAGNLGVLTTTVSETQFDVVPPSATSGINAWAAFAIRFQHLYPQSFLGDRARALTGFSWNSSSTVVATTYPGCTVQIGHASDTVAQTGLPGGSVAAAYGDTPLVVTYPVAYGIAAAGASAWTRGPAWTQAWLYDGARPIVLEVAHNGGGTNYWRCNTAYGQSTWSAAPPVTPATATWMFQTRFHYLTPGAEAQSLFYDLLRSNARVLPQQLVPITQPQGTAIQFQWQGARDSVASPGTPDLSTLTAFITDIRQLSNYRFIRWRATLVNNLSSLTAPRLDTLTVPYTYR